MCVAIYIKPGASVSPEMLAEGFRCNPDGAGYAFAANGKVEIRRSLKWNKLRHMYEREKAQYGDTSAFIVHFRIKSHGLVNKENCHPFRMADGGAIIHNGMIDIPCIPEGESDTRWFVKSVLDRLPRGWESDPVWCNGVSKMIGSGSKAAAIWPDGRSFIFNEKSGNWSGRDGTGYVMSTAAEDEKGVWYSNRSCNLPVAGVANSAPKVNSSTAVTTGPRSTVLTDSRRTFSVVGNRRRKLDPAYWREESAESGRWFLRDEAERRDYLAQLDAMPLRDALTVMQRDRAAVSDPEADFNEEMLEEAMCPNCMRDCKTRQGAEKHWAWCARVPSDGRVVKSEMRRLM